MTFCTALYFFVLFIRKLINISNRLNMVAGILIQGVQ
jgi:hypothetical protein